MTGKSMPTTTLLLHIQSCHHRTHVGRHNQAAKGAVCSGALNSLHAVTPAFSNAKKLIHCMAY